MLACTASSDGKIHLYDMSFITPSSPSAPYQKIELVPIGEYDTKGTRLTCMTLAETEHFATDGPPLAGKRKRVDDDDRDGKAARISKSGMDKTKKAAYEDKRLEEDDDEEVEEEEVEEEEEEAGDSSEDPSEEET
jgi:protein MAK11